MAKKAHWQTEEHARWYDEQIRQKQPREVNIFNVDKARRALEHFGNIHDFYGTEKGDSEYILDLVRSLYILKAGLDAVEGNLQLAKTNKTQTKTDGETYE